MRSRRFVELLGLPASASLELRSAQLTRFRRQTLSVKHLNWPAHSQLTNFQSICLSIRADPVGSLVRFDQNGDGLGRYNIYNFQRSNLSTTGFTYKRIGNWSDLGLKLNLDHIHWNVKRPPGLMVPTSRCSEPCDIGEIKITQSTGETCCWICQMCKPYEFVSDKSKCQDCKCAFRLFGRSFPVSSGQ